jgi:acyl transferase domain-containing protein
MCGFIKSWTPPLANCENSGSVKTNVGHLEGGSGLAGILKCILILEKGVIPPNALFEKLNIKINAKRNKVQVCIVLAGGISLL